MKKFSTITMVALVTALLVANCADRDKGSNNKPVGAISFVLADGVTPISSPSADDYNPTLLVNAANNESLILLYASNVSGSHKIYMATETGQYPGGPFPSFNTPVEVNSSGTPLITSATDRINFTAEYAGGTVKIYYTAANSDVMKVTLDNATSGTFTTAAANVKDNTPSNRKGKVLSMKYLPSAGGSRLVYRDSTSGNVFVTDPSGNFATEETITNSEIGANSGFTYLPEDVVFESDAYLYTAWDPQGAFGGEVYGGNGDFYRGSLFDLNDALFFQGLVATYVSAFHNPVAPFPSNGFTFSAGFSQSGDQDLYAVSSHPLDLLWILIDAGFGPAGFASETPEPNIVFGDMAPANDAVLLFFDKDIYSNIGGGLINGVNPGCDHFTVVFNQNSGTATNATCVRVCTDMAINNTCDGGSTDPIGGEFGLSLWINVTGVPDGNEYIDITPASGVNGIYSFDNFEALPNTTSVFLWPPPTIDGLSVFVDAYAFDTPGHSAFDFSFFSDYGVGGDALISTPVDCADFTVNFLINGGTAGSATCAAVCAQFSTDEFCAGGPLFGGENDLRMWLAVGPAPDGNETVEIQPVASSVFGTGGAAANTETTGVQNLVP